nr:MAG TPA: hypothetical protein [Caudoviricetes sp.]
MDLTKVHRYTPLRRTEKRLLVLATDELILMVLMLLLKIMAMMMR